MSDFDRDALSRKYTALQRDIHVGDPLVDQIEAGLRPSRPVYQAGKKEHDEPTGQFRRYSQVARADHDDRISKAVDAAREIRCAVADSRWYEQEAKLDYLHSNLPDRRVLPFDEDGHKLNVMDLGHAREVEHYRRSLEASTTAPGGRAVVLVSESAPTYTPKLPWGLTDNGEVASSVVAFPVPLGFSVERVARLVLHFFPPSCHWCGNRRAERGLLVSADPTVYVFPTCLSCGLDLDREFEDRGGRFQLDFVTNDGEFAAFGFPADRHI